MSCRATVDFPHLEILEGYCKDEVSVIVLAELERELFRLQEQLAPDSWAEFCAYFSSRPIGRVLQAARSTAYGSQGDFVEELSAGSFKARATSQPSVPHLLQAWEYGLPFSRSLRCRRTYFARELNEAVQSVVQARILALGAGRMREAASVLSSLRLTNAHFVSIDRDSHVLACLRKQYAAEDLELICGGWEDFCAISPCLGSFDLIYSPAWLDEAEDAAAHQWLSAAAELLRPQGRLLATCFAPHSRDAGWVEACFGIRPNYRSAQECARLAVHLKVPGLRGHAVFPDESGASNHLEVYAL